MHQITKTKFKTLLTLVAVMIFLPGYSLAQKKLDLDDLNIKGELHNDDRIKMLAREHNQMKNYVKYRTHYRNEILESVPPTEDTKKEYSFPQD